MGHSHEYNIKYGLKVAGDSTSSGDLLPSASGVRGVGTPPIAWASGYFDVLEAGTSLYAKTIYGDGSKITNLNLGASDHSTLGNLTWSTAGHTIDADIVPTASGAQDVGTQAVAFAEANADIVRGTTIYGTTIYTTSITDGHATITGGAITNATNTNWDAAYTHSIDNTQAHSDYLINTGDTIAGDLTPDASGSRSIGTQAVAFDEMNAATIRADAGIFTDLYAGAGTLYVGGIALTEGAGGVLDIATHRISSIVDPVGAQDAATKAYVDAQVAVENLWDHTGTELSPYNASDDIVPNASGAQHVGTRDLPFSSGVFDAIVLEKYSIIANKENVDIDTGTEVIDSFADTLGDAAIWDYMIKNGANRRAGNVVACWDSNANTTEYMETHTNDLGDTSGLTLSVDINTDLVRLLGTATSDDWHCKVIRRLI